MKRARTEVCVIGLCAWIAVGGGAPALRGGVASAHAQGAPSAGPSFSWVRLPGAEPCIAQAELAAKVEARVGQAVFVRPSEAIMLVEGRVAPVPGGFEAVVTVSDRDGHGFGERALTIAGTDCRALDEVVSLVIAVTLRGGPTGLPLPPELSAQLEALFGDEPSVIDPNTLPSPLPRASENSAPEPSATRSDQPGRVPSGREPRTPEHAFELGFDVGMTVATGLQPDGTLAPSLRVQLSLPAFGAIALSGGYGLEQQLAVDDPMSSADGTIALRAPWAALSLCAPAMHALASTLDACARFGVGRLIAKASGFDVHNGELPQWWSELGPELSLRTPLLGPLHARLAIGLPIRLSRPDLVYLQQDGRRERAFRVTGLGVMGELALGLTLP